MRVTLRRTILVLAMSSSAAGQGPQEPSNSLNPNRPHIELFLEGRVPKVQFFASRDLSGSPVIEVNDVGVFVRGELECSWPGGRYDLEAWDNMVLGYVDKEATNFTGCPAGLPIRSFWYEEFGRHAKLYIEVTRRRASSIEVTYRTTKLYADMNLLPGDPREPNDNYRIRSKGFTGWAWWRSGREEEREYAADLARLRRDRTLIRFLRDAKACLTSAKAPECFAAFVKPGIYLPEAKTDDTDWYVTPERFVEFTWRHSDASGHRPWDELVACLTTSTLQPYGSNAARFETERGHMCEIERTKAGWKLTMLLEGC